MKLVQGQAYYTVKMLGLAKKPDGRLQVSQKIGQDGGPDIPTTEALVFIGREEGKLWFTREDGTKICAHPSHFDRDHAYNRQGGIKNASSKLNNAKSKVAKAEAELAQAVEKLASLAKEIGPDGVAKAMAISQGAVQTDNVGGDIVEILPIG